MAQNFSLRPDNEPPLKSVADRERPEYAPIGGRLGSFILYPEFSLQGTATDNVFANSLNTHGDVYLDARAEARLQSLWSRHALAATAYVDQTAHARYPQEDTTQYGGSLGGTLNVSRRTIVALRVDGGRRTSERTYFLNVPASREPVRYDRYSSEIVAAQELYPVKLIGSFSITRFDYLNARDSTGAVLDLQNRDYDRYLGALVAVYEVSSNVGLLARAEFGKSDYRLGANAPSNGGLARDSDSTRIEGGVTVGRPALLSGSVRAGYLQVRYDDPRYRGVSGPSFAADLLWNVTPLTSVRLAADRTTDEGGSIYIAGYRTTAFGGTVDHELLRNLILTGRGSYAVSTPIDVTPGSPAGLGLTQKAREAIAGADARYLVSRRFSLVGGYQYHRRSTADASFRYDENRVRVGVKVTL